MSTGIEQSALGDGHEVLYFVYSQLAGDDPAAIFALLNEHLAFLSRLDEKRVLVTGGPFEEPDGTNSGNGIYVLRTASFAAAEEIVAQDPLHKARIRIPHIRRWNRKKDWSVLPDPRQLPS
jgi:uncharacterized protein YciI